MPSQNRREKIIIIVFSVALLTLLPYTQYHGYLNTVKVTRQQLRLNSLGSKIIYLDNAQAIASGSYLMSSDPQWEKYYKSLQEDFKVTLSAINNLLPGGFEGKQELLDSHVHLIRMEENAFMLVNSGKVEEAKKLLTGIDYLAERSRFSAAMKQLMPRLEKENDSLYRFLRWEAIKNILIRASIALLVFMGWIWFSKINSRWKRKLNDLNEQRAKEERAAAEKLEQVNGQLRELSIYLLDVREKERMALASEINEQLGQQIAAIKLRIAEVRSVQNGTDKSWQVELENIASQLDKILHQIRNLATEVYPLVLRDLGLAEALQWESERVSNQSGAVVMFTYHFDDINLDHRTTTTLFRTYQQKLQTCLSQGAKEITSSLHLGKDILQLNILDDGIVPPGEENNLMEDMALQERLQSIKGLCQSQFRTITGNHFTISIPYAMS
jgi:signal transduction histidine kinase